MQKGEALTFQSTGTGSPSIRKYEQYLSPLRLSLRDLIAAGADSGGIVSHAVMLLCTSRYHWFFVPSGCCSWGAGSFWNRPRLDLMTFTDVFSFLFCPLLLVFFLGSVLEASVGWANLQVILSQLGKGKQKACTCQDHEIGQEIPLINQDT